MQNVVETADLSNTLAGREKDFENLILPLAKPGYRLACAMLHDPQAAQDAGAEMVIDAGNHPTTSGKSKWGIYRVRQGVESARWSDCTAFQIDGEGFSKVFVA